MCLIKNRINESREQYKHSHHRTNQSITWIVVVVVVALSQWVASLSCSLLLRMISIQSNTFKFFCSLNADRTKPPQNMLWTVEATRLPTKSFHLFWVSWHRSLIQCLFQQYFFAMFANTTEHKIVECLLKTIYWIDELSYEIFNYRVNGSLNILDWKTDRDKMSIHF